MLHSFFFCYISILHLFLENVLSDLKKKLLESIINRIEVESIEVLKIKLPLFFGNQFRIIKSTIKCGNNERILK